jgi:hypothetical protein
MGINVAWQNEFGGELASLLDSKNHLAHALESIDCNSMSCLRFIDRYGNTVFNRLQIPTIIAVLEKASSQVSNPAQLTIIKELLRFVKNGEGEVHTYLKFIGD